MSKEPDDTYFLDHYFPNDKLNLSDRITAFVLQPIVTEQLRIAFSKSIKMQKLIKEMAQYTNSEPLRKSAREIISTARSLMDGDLSEQREFVKSLESLPDLAEDASQLERAYAKVAKAAAKFDEVALEKAVENAMEKKAMSNAFKIAVTEISRAHSLGVFTRAKEDEDVLAMQIDLNGTNNCDDCIELCTEDNGGGEGVYDTDNCPAVPIHSHCGCTLTPVYVMNGDPSDLRKQDKFDVMEAMDD
jgi:hypothetical protein